MERKGLFKYTVFATSDSYLGYTVEQDIVVIQPLLMTYLKKLFIVTHLFLFIVTLLFLLIDQSARKEGGIWKGAVGRLGERGRRGGHDRRECD